MNVSEILTIIIGYIYLFLSIGINIVKVVYFFIKKEILPNLLLYYVLKVLSGFAGLFYGLTFLDKVGYYLVTPFLAVVLLDFIVLGIICVLNLKQYINNLHKIQPENLVNASESKLNKINKIRSKLTSKITKNKPNRPRSKSMSNLLLYEKPNILRQTKSVNSITEIEQHFMSNYIKQILAEYTFHGEAPKSNIRIPQQVNYYNTKSKTKQVKKSKTKPSKKSKKKSFDSTKDILMDECENVEEFLFDEDEEYSDDLDEDLDEDEDEDIDMEESDIEIDEEEEEGISGLFDYLGGLINN